MKTLSNKRIAILVADGFEQVEFTKPKAALEEAGASTYVVSPSADKVQGVNHDIEKGDKFPVHVTIANANPQDFDALLLPGGLKNPDTLRQNSQAVDFVRAFFFAGKPVAAICHAPQILIEAGVVKGRKLTSWPAIKTDLVNAGAEWVDQEMVCDQGLVTSRKPDDIPAFNAKMIEEFAEGRHRKQAEKTAAALANHA